MLTLAFGQVVYGAIIKWASLTGGDQGLVGGIPRPPIHLGFMVWDINVPENFYVLIVIVVMASMFICKVLVDSPFGAILKAIRENPERVYYAGLNVRRYQTGRVYHSRNLRRHFRRFDGYVRERGLSGLRLLVQVG